MVAVLINLILYLVTLLFYWKKVKTIDNGLILLFTYTFVAFACLVNLILNPLDQIEYTVLPFIYLFIINLFFFRPFLQSKINITDKLKIKKSPIYFIFIYLYIILAGVVLFYGYDSTIQIILRNDWNSVRQDIYAGNNNVYENQIERFAKVFIGFLQPMAILFFFYLLTDEFSRKHRVTIIMLLLAIILPSTITIISVASRGMVILLFVQFLVSYFIFKNKFSKKINQTIFKGGIALLAVFLIYSISVTKSRFEENASSDLGAQDSLIFYFGHSMLTFAYGLTDTIREFLWGDYLLGKEEILKVGIDNLLGTHFDTKFFTYVGALYLDFGPFFTLIIAVIFPLIMSLIFQFKKNVDMADLMIYVYYLTFLINGVFVVGIGYYIGWIMIFIIYFIFKTVKLIA